MKMWGSNNTQHEKRDSCEYVGCKPVYPARVKHGLKDPKSKEVSLMADKRAQFTLRGDTAHFQYGDESSYEKYDVPATADLRAFYDQAVEDGDTENSLAGTSTQYAPVSAVAPKAVAFEMVLAKTIRVEV